MSTDRPRPVDQRGVPLGAWLHTDALEAQAADAERRAIAELAVRVTAAQRRAAAEVVASVREGRRRVDSEAAFVEALCVAVLAAEDDKQLRVLVTTESAALSTAYGPFVSEVAARNAVDAGLASRPGVRGRILRLVPTPRNDVATKIGATRKAPTTRKRAQS